MHFESNERGSVLAAIKPVSDFLSLTFDGSFVGTHYLLQLWAHMCLHKQIPKAVFFFCCFCRSDIVYDEIPPFFLCIKKFHGNRCIIGVIVYILL